MPARPNSSSAFHPRIDDYIAKSPAFAQPILHHLRTLVHRAIPQAEETLKWRMPFFTVNGIILCHMAAFKAHVAFGLWGAETTAALKSAGIAKAGNSMGSFGRVASLKDLPKDKDLIAFLRGAADEVLSGQRTTSYQRPKRKLARPEPPIPPELSAALKQSKPAQQHFADFSPSCRREYIEWVAEAKRDQTRLTRAAQAVAWIAEGKSRNWKYERK